VKEVEHAGDEKCTAIAIFGSIQYKWPEHGMFPQCFMNLCYYNLMIQCW